MALLGGVILLALGAAVLVALNSEPWDAGGKEKPPATVDPTLPAVPPLKSVSSTPARKSEFLSTGPEVKYVGSEACRNCHAEHTETFLANPPMPLSIILCRSGAMKFGGVAANCGTGSCF